MALLSTLKFGYFFTIVIFFIFLESCQKPIAPERHLKIYHETILNDVKTWDPANAYDSISLAYLPNIVESLYQYDFLAEHYELIPWLAQSLPELSSDGLIMRIKIKTGILFQEDPCFEGKKRILKAEDFVNGFKRLALPQLSSSGWWALDEKIQGINAFRQSMLTATSENFDRLFQQKVSGIQALDLNTLEFHFTKPYPEFEWILAMTFSAPVPWEAMKAYADQSQNLTDHPIGTGPFFLKSWTHSREIILEKNPNFHPVFFPGKPLDPANSLPWIDQVQVSILKEALPAWFLFKQEKIETIGLGSDHFNEVFDYHGQLKAPFATKKIQVNYFKSTAFFYIGFNMLDSLLGSNKKLRQAISSALDRKEYISLFSKHSGRLSPIFLPPGLKDSPRRDRMLYDFDLTRAKKLLIEAGYPDGKGLPELVIDLQSVQTRSRQYGEWLKRSLKKIGIRLAFHQNTFPAYLQKSKENHLQIFEGGWNLDYPSPLNVYQIFYGPNVSPGPNQSNFKNSIFDALFESASLLPSGKTRQEKIEAMETILQEEVPVALMFISSDIGLAQPWVRNMNKNPFLSNRFLYVDLQRDWN